MGTVQKFVRNDRVCAARGAQFVLRLRSSDSPDKLASHRSVPVLSDFAGRLPYSVTSAKFPLGPSYWFHGTCHGRSVILIPLVPGNRWHACHSRLLVLLLPCLVSHLLGLVWYTLGQLSPVPDAHQFEVPVNGLKIFDYVPWFPGSVPIIPLDKEPHRVPRPFVGQDTVN